MSRWSRRGEREGEEEEEEEEEICPVRKGVEYKEASLQELQRPSRDQKRRERPGTESERCVGLGSSSF